VLVPLQRSGETVVFRGGTIPVGTGPHATENPPERSDLPRYSAVFWPLENVGSGPALNVKGAYVGPRGRGKTRFAIEGLAAGARGVVAFENWDGDSLNYTGNDSVVEAEIGYQDLEGTQYATTMSFDIGNNAYRSSPAEFASPSGWREPSLVRGWKAMTNLVLASSSRGGSDDRVA
jgi:hypothetical protein